MQISPTLPARPAPTVGPASPAVFAQPSKHPLLQRRRILPRGFSDDPKACWDMLFYRCPLPVSPVCGERRVLKGGVADFPLWGENGTKAVSRELRETGRSYLHGGFRRTPTHGAGTAEAGVQRTAGFCLIRLGCVSLHLPAYVCY